MESDMELLIETLAELRDEDLWVFKTRLGSVFYDQHHPDLQQLLWEEADRQEVVFLMVQTHGCRAVEEIREILMRMKRNDLVQSLSDRSSRTRSKMKH